MLSPQEITMHEANERSPELQSFCSEACCPSLQVGLGTAWERHQKGGEVVKLALQEMVRAERGRQGRVEGGRERGGGSLLDVDLREEEQVNTSPP